MLQKIKTLIASEYNYITIRIGIVAIIVVLKTHCYYECKIKSMENARRFKSVKKFLALLALCIYQPHVLFAFVLTVNAYFEFSLGRNEHNCTDFFLVIVNCALHINFEVRILVNKTKFSRKLFKTV